MPEYSLTISIWEACTIYLSIKMFIYFYSDKILRLSISNFILKTHLVEINVSIKFQIASTKWKKIKIGFCLTEFILLWKVETIENNYVKMVSNNHTHHLTKTSLSVLRAIRIVFHGKLPGGKILCNKTKRNSTTSTFNLLRYLYIFRQ